MSRSIEAIYERGSLRPLEDLPLEEGTHVKLLWEVVPAIESKLDALNDLVGACAKMTDEQWRTFEEASARRTPFFRSSEEET